MEIYTNVLECAKEVIDSHKDILIDGDGKSTVKAIGITNQRETTVAWDRHTGQPLHNAIVWHDSRTADIVSRIKTDIGESTVEQLRQRCGLPINTYFSAVKMRWLLENAPKVK